MNDTEFTIGEYVKKKRGKPDQGEILAILLDGEMAIITVLSDQGKVYEVPAEKLTYCDGKRKAVK